MLKNIWRYSHLVLAVLSSLFVLIAAVTGIILSIEPIDDELMYVRSQQTIPLRTTIDSLSARYELLIDISRSDAGHTIASISDSEYDGAFVIDPTDGTVLGPAPQKRWIFSFATNLHRSLFLKSTGRALVGIASFLLFLIAISGMLLLIKRQQGWRQALSRIIKDDIYQYWHVITGRLQIVPIIIITLTGVYLSLYRFELIKSEVPELIEHEVDEETTDAVLDPFQSITTADIELLEFPFSEDEYDYYYLTLPDRKLGIHQYTGQIVEEESFGAVHQITPWMHFLHTGRGSILWSIILGLASINILYFMYSGTMISIRRLSSSVKNKIKPAKAQYVILYGSENGSTKRFASMLLKELLDAKISAYADELNSYQVYPEMRHLIVMTSTYGLGDPPSNASEFVSMLDQVSQPRKVDFSVLGFGSLAYEDFCQYAIDVQAALESKEDYEYKTNIQMITNQSFTDFKSWTRTWAKDHNLDIEITTAPRIKIPKLIDFTIIDRRRVLTDVEDTYTLTLRPAKRKKWVSGDLLALYPDIDKMERLYSMGRDQSGDILLSIKRHEHGVCSNLMLDLPVGNTLRAHIQRNKKFHLPKKASKVIFIANGTGIAPFLGMMHDRPHLSKELYWGGRTREGYTLYDADIQAALVSQTLMAVHTAYSREDDSDHRYVQDLLHRDIDQVIAALTDGAALMLCGSVAMQDGVFSLLTHELDRLGDHDLAYYRRRRQVLTDCY